MKRLLLSVFAAAITAVWAMPATATDFSFSGQYRVRGEYRGNPDFYDAQNESQVFQRVRLTTRAQVTDDTSVKITLQDSRTWGASSLSKGGPTLTDTGDNTLDLHESYMQVNNLLGQPVSIKIGRQELVYGEERLIGAFGWNNNGRSFDAAKLTYSSEPVNVDLWGSKIRDNNASDSDQDFYGLYATVKAVPMNTIDVYVLYLRDGNTGTGVTPFGFGNTIGNTSISGTLDKVQQLYTYGFAIKGGYQAFDYRLEVPFQSGSIDTDSTSYDIKAWALSAKAGYTLPTAMKIRIGVEYDHASGDADTNDTDIETFFNLFPTNHGHYGFADQQGWRNVDAWSINATAQATEKLKLYLAYWNFKLDENIDAWYGAGNWNNTPSSGLRAPNASNTTDDVGSEIDVVATYKYNSAVTAQLGYSRFFTGDFIDAYNTIHGHSSEDMDFAYLQIVTNF